ncbi:MAG: DUF5682 family protein [Bacteroidales bacterium]|nr:DUF5682 family protein [Bacteroidales bacterium]
MSEIQFFGIRHHGPGSSKNVIKALQKMQPDIILLEGPPEADNLIKMVSHNDMIPPVALLSYQTDDTKNAVLYPFAEFSPEWQVMKFANKNNIQIRFFDLPLIYILNHQNFEEEKDDIIEQQRINDPFSLFAQISGLKDGEEWWNEFIETKTNSDEIFIGIEEAITELRQTFPNQTDKRDLIREAWMRKQIKIAQKDIFSKIAVVCGAWHVPGLKEKTTLNSDNETLKGLSKVKVECTWIPWTYDRLTKKSGYGAGIISPGWYHHIFENQNDDGTLWLSKVANTLREKKFDISVAHVIDSLELAKASALLRNLHKPSLKEFDEAVISVMGFGDKEILNIVKEELTVSNRIGKVPNEVPKVPLLADFEKIQKQLKIPFTSDSKELILDLRKSLDLNRSIFFHRIKIFDIKWAKELEINGLGTFKEQWKLIYNENIVLTIIEKAIWGNTVKEAVTHYIEEYTQNTNTIKDISKILENVIPADLSDLEKVIIQQLDTISANSSDVLDMMISVPNLANIVKYGNVRNIDYTHIKEIFKSLIARIVAGGILICSNVDEDTANNILDNIIKTNTAIFTINEKYTNKLWDNFLVQIFNSKEVHPLIKGFATRLIYNKGEISMQKMQNAINYYTSKANSANDMAYWLEGFLKMSGTVLVVDDNLWNIVNQWIKSLDNETFIILLPILRRTFCKFSQSEKTKLGEKAKNYGESGIKIYNEEDEFSNENSEKIISLISQLLNLKLE